MSDLRAELRELLRELKQKAMFNESQRSQNTLAWKAVAFEQRLIVEVLEDLLSRHESSHLPDRQAAGAQGETQMEIITKLAEDIDTELWGPEGSKGINARGRIVPLIHAALMKYAEARW